MLPQSITDIFLFGCIWVYLIFRRGVSCVISAFLEGEGVVIYDLVINQQYVQHASLILLDIPASIRCSQHLLTFLLAS